MEIKLRRFTTEDIPLKVSWINDPKNNRFLHYDLPLTEEGTAKWFDKNKDSKTRLDLTILADDVPVGIIGLLNITKNDAELYITVGEHEYKGKGIAKASIKMLLDYAFTELALNKVYLTTEDQNISAISAYKKSGMTLITDTQNACCKVPEGRVYFEVTKEEFRK